MMSSLFQLHLHPKISSISRKFFTSAVALLENSSISLEDHVENPIFVNPLCLLDKITKSRNFTLPEIKSIHTHLLTTGILCTDTLPPTSLLDCYWKCGDFESAIKLFDEIPNPTVVSWNLMIAGFNKSLLFNDSWRFFCRMHFSGIRMTEYSYGGVLSACSALGSRGNLYGQQVYGGVIKNGYFTNGYVRAGMIDLFVKMGKLEDALRVFYDDELCDNVVCWNTIISGAVKSKGYRVSLEMFRRMCSQFLMPNGFTFSSTLTACAALEEIDFGKGVQGWVLKCGVGGDIFVGTAIVDLYAKCGAMGEAVKQFSCMPVRNVVSWTAIISGFVQKGDSVSAVRFFNEMRNLGVEINMFTVTSVLTACAGPDMFNEGIMLHCWAIKVGLYADPAVKSSLINMYSKIGAIDLSETVFAEMEDVKHLNMWTSMISALAQYEWSRKAMQVFQRMFLAGVRPEKFCCASILSVVDNLSFGQQIHGYIFKAGLLFDVSVGSSLFTMYSKCGQLDQSYEVFELLNDKDNVSWTSMISGFVEHGYPVEAIQLFKQMLFEEAIPDEMTLCAVVSACSALHLLGTGKEVHCFAIRHGIDRRATVGGALVNMYSKCSKLEMAKRVFNLMSQKDKVSCSALISGYAQSGHVDEAIQLVNEMLVADLDIDSFTISSIIGAVGLKNWPRAGAQIHGMTVKLGLDSEASVGSSMVMMYSRCGSISDCFKAFEKIRKPDLVSWTTMIVSFAEHGKGLEALEVYEKMRKSGVKPDSITFVAVLTACSHAGLVEKGYFHLNSMMKEYGIKPACRHYACMVDVLGRSGRLEEAMNMINAMPLEPDALVWGTLLAACKVHGNVELGKIAAERFMELQPSEAGPYVALSNMCAEMGQWEQVQTIRNEMKGIGMMKEPGWSFVR